MARWIEESVTKYTGVTDHNDVEAIMDVMADRVRTFSGLSPREFKRIAKQAAGMVAYLKTDEGKASWEATAAAYGL